MYKPYSEACERNKEPILEILKSVLAKHRDILEIGSGTGQHSVFFAEKMPQLVWQTSDLLLNHIGIVSWINDSGLDNIIEPIELDVSNFDWGSSKIYDSVYTANTFHIMSWENVKITLANVGKIIKNGGCFCVYGPFNYQGNYTSESNRNFDFSLKRRDPLSGIRDFEDICQYAKRGNLIFRQDNQMPANNRLLVFQNNKYD